MITIITGLPGHGKTLYAVASVPGWFSGRPIYQDGIPELTLPWERVQGSEWHKLPSGAVVVIDEAQRVFPPRPVGAVVPEHVREFETHRHRGLDVVLITQNAMLLDHSVRRLCGRHIHLRRLFGGNKATVFEAAEVFDPSDRRDLERTHSKVWSYPKSCFGLYKSAEIHTVKRRIPAKFLLVPVAVAAVGGFVWLGYSTLLGSEGIGQSGKVEGLEGANERRPVWSDGGDGKARVSRAEAVQAYLEERAPVIQGLPHTAPLYAGAMKVQSVPYPAACVATAKRCQCWTDQATKIDVPEHVCREIVERGFYVEWISRDDAVKSRGAKRMPTEYREDKEVNRDKDHGRKGDS